MKEILGATGEFRYGLDLNMTIWDYCYFAEVFLRQVSQCLKTLSNGSVIPTPLKCI